MLRSASAQTLPPRPPSPPFGPPNGMNFSRLKLMQPAPPSPAAMSIVASSTNFMLSVGKRRSPGGPGLRYSWPSLGSGRRHEHRLLIQRALNLVRDLAVDERKQRVVL